MTATIAGAIILAEILMVGDSSIANVAQGANPQDGCEQRQKAAEIKGLPAKITKVELSDVEKMPAKKAACPLF